MSDSIPPGGGDGWAGDGSGDGAGDGNGGGTLVGIEPIEIQEEMERSFLDYAM